MPHTAAIVDDICIIRSMQTEAINHDPAITFVQTGSQLAGRPSMGSWVAYGLGSMNQDLPAFVVLLSRGRTDQPLYDRLWGSGFLPTRYQGVKLRGEQGAGALSGQPAGCSRPTRRQMLDDIAALDDLHHAETGDPEILTRVAQYELAYRMQASVPELTDLSSEPQSVLDLYGPDVQKPGSYAANCLLARRLAERGVRFIQLYHMGWDQHNDLPIPDPRPVPRHRPAVGGPGQGPEAARACSTTRWSSGAASSAGPSIPRASSRPPTTAATTTRAASPSGWPAAASSRA